MKALKYYERVLFFFSADFTNEQILKWVQDNMDKVVNKDERMYINDHWSECTADLIDDTWIKISGDETAIGLDIETVEIISKA